MRLERLLSRVPGVIDKQSRDAMLKNRLWSGLRDPELRNMSRYKFEKEIDFNKLRRELRSMEEDLKISASTERLQLKPDVQSQLVKVDAHSL